MAAGDEPEGQSDDCGGEENGERQTHAWISLRARLLPIKMSNWATSERG